MHLQGVSGAAARTGIGEKEENIKIVRMINCGIEKKFNLGSNILVHIIGGSWKLDVERS